LLSANAMEFICRHCDKLTIGAPYRVMSEESGVILLDMIVCQSCYEQARDLGLHAEEISLPAESHGRRAVG
jgi:RNase P subunit RPR2